MHTTIGERIAYLVKELGMTRVAFGAGIGISSPGMTMLCNGRNKPSNRTIKAICNIYRVNEQWLRYGEGEVFNYAASAEVEKLALERGLSKKDAVIIERILSLDPRVWKKVVDFIDCIAAEMNKVEDEPMETESERDARLLREEADAVERGAGKFSASPSQEKGKKEA